MSTHRIALLAVIMLAVVTTFSSPALAAVILVPSGLNPGDTYHLAFVSSTTRGAWAPDIADYDAHVQAAADAAGIGVGSPIGDITWKAIVSVETVDAASTVIVDAITHIGVMGPVFRLDDVMIATSETDLFDGSLLSSLSISETLSSIDYYVWTGSDYDGMVQAPLGNGPYAASFGYSSSTNSPWLYYSNTNKSNDLHIYGISTPLEAPGSVVPEPGSILMLSLGAVGMMGYGWRRKRKTAIESIEPKCPNR